MQIIVAFFNKAVEPLLSRYRQIAAPFGGLTLSNVSTLIGGPSWGCAAGISGFLRLLGIAGWLDPASISSLIFFCALFTAKASQGGI